MKLGNYEIYLEPIKTHEYKCFICICNIYLITNLPIELISRYNELIKRRYPFPDLCNYEIKVINTLPERLVVIEKLNSKLDGYILKLPFSWEYNTVTHQIEDITELLKELNFIENPDQLLDEPDVRRSFFIEKIIKN